MELTGPDVRGAYVPMVTPLAADGTVDLDTVGGLVDWLVSGGVEGLVALGTTGEFADLVAEDRARLARAAVEAASGRVPVWVGVGGVGTSEACAHAERARAAGADGVLALPPLYWKLGDAGLRRHFTAVADAAGVPVLLYDFPALAGTALPPGLIAALGRDVPGIVGVKLSGPELGTVHAVVAQRPPGFSVMVGSAGLVLPGLLGGADGTIAALANVAPGVVAGIVDACRRGDLDLAARRHRLLLDWQEVAALSSPPVLALKAAAGAAGAPVAPHVRTVPDGADATVERARNRARELLAADRRT